MNRRFRLLFTIVFLLLSERAQAQPSLVGTRESLQRQNRVADLEGLIRIENDTILEEMIKRGELVRIPKTVRIDPRLDEKWHWVLPRVVRFLEDIPIRYIDLFGQFFQLNSAVRTVPRQIEIALGDGVTPPNKNAAPVKGDRSSPHLTGASIDIAKKGMNESELRWMKAMLLDREGKSLIDATEEQDQPVFHIMVFDTYSGQTQKAN